MSVAARAASRLSWLVVPSSRTRLFLVTWGILAALYGGTHLSRHVSFPIGNAGTGHAFLLPAHADGVRAARRVLDRGGPPLLGSRVPYGTSKHPQRDYYALGQGDQGLYVVLPLMGKWLGLTAPGVALKWLLIALVTMLMVVYPLLFYELAGSALVALLAPFVLLRTIDSIDGLDVYWLSAWTTLAFAPLLLLVASRWSFRRAPVLAIIVLAASLTSTIRSGAGLVVLSLALAISLLVERKLRLRVALVTVCAAAWLAGPLAVKQLQHHRDRAVGVELADAQPSAWETLYAGLGWIDNPYGIVYGPQAALTVARVDHVPVSSPEHVRAVRRRLARLVRHEPGFVADALATKARAVERAAFSRSPIFWILLPFALSLGALRSRMRRFTALLAPGFAVAFAAPVLTVPERRYETPLDGILTVATLLVAGWAVEAVREWSPWLAGREGPPWPLPVAGRHESWRLLPAAPVLVLAVLVAAPWLIRRSAVSESADTIAFYAPTAASLTPPSAARGGTVRTWSFVGGLPEGWRPAATSRLHAVQGGTSVTTTTSTSGYELRGPALRLRPASYRVVVDGRVQQGGLWLGVVDEASTVWIGGRGFWSGRGNYRDDRMTLAVDVTGGSERIAFANWGPPGTRSSWIIHSVSILSGRGASS